MRWVAILVVVTAACSAGGGGAPASDGVASRRRVVSLHDVTTEIVVALGATDRLVGVAEPVDVTGATARAIAGVPRVGGLESILAVHPDLVIGTGVVADHDPELVARLRERGVEVLVPAQGALADAVALIGAIAARVDAVDRGARVTADLEARLAPAAPRGPVRRVFVYDCCQPPFTAGARTIATELIARAGGENVFADLDAAWAHVSWEEVLARRPALIVIDAYRDGGDDDVAAKRAAIGAMPGLAGVPIVVVPLGELLGGLRSADGLDRLRAAIGAGA